MWWHSILWKFQVLIKLTLYHTLILTKCLFYYRNQNVKNKVFSIYINSSLVHYRTDNLNFLTVLKGKCCKQKVAQNLLKTLTAVATSIFSYVSVSGVIRKKTFSIPKRIAFNPKGLINLTCPVRLPTHQPTSGYTFRDTATFLKFKIAGSILKLKHFCKRL